jgi:hypothetical protein
LQRLADGPGSVQAAFQTPVAHADFHGGFLVLFFLLKEFFLDD